jgi:hypothetical protein
MIKRLLIKWNSSDGTEKSGKYWLAASLLSSEYKKDMVNDLVSDEIIEVVIKALYHKYVLQQLYWWIKYGFKCNKMYWYKSI